MRLGWRAILAGVYAILLLTSHVVRWSQPEPPLAPDELQVELPAIRGGRTLDRDLRLVYDSHPARQTPAEGTIVLLHGSPGNKENFDGMIEVLAERYDLIVPDLPGFGASRGRVPDHSARAHAGYVLALLDHLGVERAHVVGYSMGGGVALRMYQEVGPERFESLTLLASIGVQELELLGNYDLNHFIHGLQLAGLWFLEEGVPHFGVLDGSLLDVGYARNFYGTDQRPLRGILQDLEIPTLVLHGRQDFLVDPAAAEEHHRIVPHSELMMLDPGDHFMPFMEGPATARRLLGWVDRVEAGEAPRRAEATPERLARAAEPFDPTVLPAASGLALAIVVILLMLATLVSEDLTCIGAGLLVSQGRVDLFWAIAACCVGIVVGDLLMFLAGRWIGRPALSRAPLRWWISPFQVEMASDWFQRRGAIVIVLSRFAPGTRLPTYFAAGSLRTSIVRFTFYFTLAVLLWTPAVVGLTAFFGETAVKSLQLFQRYGLWAVALLFGWMFLLLKVGVPALTHRGRRRLVGTWKRWTQWEFWPFWLSIVPLVVHWLYLGLVYRNPFYFTAANPSIPDSGFISETKEQILRGLAADPANDAWIARFELLPAGVATDERVLAAERFLQREGLEYPVVLKPDRGQRGSGVAIVQGPEPLRRYLEQASYDTLIQEFVPGPEFGLFYVRHPDEERGSLFSITEKRLPELVGDGVRQLEDLILDDPRAVVMADHYLYVQGAAARHVPAEGERVRLVELGTHCRGAVFLDGRHLETEKLLDTVDAISRRFEGFYFGRYDVRAESVDALRDGRFKVVELNGVTSEATHVYDPAIGLLEAYRTLFRQWRLAFEIGLANARRGTPPSTFAGLLGHLRSYHRIAQQHLG